MTHRTVSLTLFALLAAFGGCERRETDNPDVAAAYRVNKYNASIVTGTWVDQTPDQGKGVRPATLMAIDDEITSSHATDFSRCLEDEMDARDTGFLRAEFDVQFTVEPDGHSHDAKVTRIRLAEQDATGQDVRKLPADQLGQCIVAAVDDWELEAKPDVTIVDTYHGRLTEAF